MHFFDLSVMNVVMKPTNNALDVKGILVLLVICASWGLSQVAIKTAIPGVSPILQAGIRSIGSSALLILWMRFRHIALFPKDGTAFYGILAGLIFSAEFILIYWGLEFTNASRAVIFMYTAPFVVVLGARLFIPGETLNKSRTAGLCLAFAGILIAFNESLSLPTREMLIGDAMLLGAAVLWGATTVLVKASPLASIEPSRTLLYQLVVSALLLPPASFIFGETGITAITPIIAASLVYQVFWIAFVTYIAWFWLIRNYSVSRIASFTFLTPFFGVLAGAWLLGEKITVFLLCALVLVAAGIYLVNRR